MTEKLGLPSGLAPDDVRTMVGVYYSMRQVGFSKTITFTLADDVSMDLIAYIKEHHEDYPGVEVQSEAVRSTTRQPPLMCSARWAWWTRASGRTPIRRFPATR